MALPGGSPVVLTADRILMGGYRLLFDGMLAATQTTTTPRCVMAALLLPRGGYAEGRARMAPLGLRRIEAALLQGGFSPAEVAVVDDRGLPRAIGPATQVIAVSAGDPGGQGMNSTTMSAVAGGRPYPQALLEELLGRIRWLRSRAPQARVVLGGPGAWQAAADPALRRRLGVDHVVCGYAEANVADLFHRLRAGEDLPEVLQGQGPAVEDIPPVRGATTMGVVEISRGCGLGCGFCALAAVPMHHLPADTIRADAQTNLAAGQTNLAAGQTNLAALSEDFFRYGGQGVRANSGALLALLESLRALPRLRLIQTDHANLSSVAQFTDGELRAVRQLLVGPTGQRWPWVNVGVETAAGELLAAAGGAAKLGSVGPGQWGEFSTAQVRRLVAAGFLPMVSLVVGLPGETPAQVQQTLAWVQAFRGQPVTIFPLLYAPLDGTAPPGVDQLTRLHWDLIRECYEFNFTWVPRLYADSQAAGGVGEGRRLLMRALGQGQVWQRRWLLARHRRRAR